MIVYFGFDSNINRYVIRQLLVAKGTAWIEHEFDTVDLAIAWLNRIDDSQDAS